jgi:alginate O-acetyltransferase complex protein AlgI
MKQRAAAVAMLFNSLDFVVFLSIVLIAYAAIPRRAWLTARLFLIAVSYLFYMAWNPPFGLLLLGSTLLDFALARRLERTEAPAARRALVTISLVGNLGVLGFFKYGGFLAESARAMIGLPPLPRESLLVTMVLPVGISFYTFQTLSYTIDVYRRALPACRSLPDFMLYVAFFPQLVAGPIVRAGEFLPQLADRPRPNGPAIEDALSRMGMGFFKKVVLADTLGALVDQVWGAPGDALRWNVVLAAYAYAYQIYFDFSGYSDIAIGVAQLFGFRLPENFDRPYLAAGPREFWQRWHISLSTWLRDYLYVPLGGNRRGRIRTHVNLMLTMLLGGLWHGAAWTFVLWGGFHGILLSIERVMRATIRLPTGRLATWAGRLLTFHLVCFGWVLFRAGTLARASAFLAGLARPGFERTGPADRALLALGLAVAAHALWRAPTLRRWHTGWPPALQGVGYAALVLLVYLFAPATSRFIYFQF